MVKIARKRLRNYNFRKSSGGVYYSDEATTDDYDKYGKKLKDKLYNKVVTVEERFPRFVIYRYGEDYKVIMTKYKAGKTQKTEEEKEHDRLNVLYWDEHIKKDATVNDVQNYEKKKKELEEKIEKQKIQERFDSSIRRTKDRIVELAMCNHWNYFLTITLNKDKFNRGDLAGVSEKLTKYIRNQQRVMGGIVYCIVPELHDDGENWHFHALINFEDEKANSKIVVFDESKAKNAKQLKKYREFNNKGIKNWESISEDFGYCTLSRVKSRFRVALYIRKYITKGLTTTLKKLDKDAKSFYSSKGLLGKELIYDGNSKEFDCSELPMKEYLYCKSGLMTSEQMDKIKIIEGAKKNAS